MQGFREERDADRIETAEQPVGELPTPERPHPLMCSMCGKTYYTDEQTFESVSRAIEEGLDNPFVCETCQQAYDELGHSL